MNRRLRRVLIVLAAIGASSAELGAQTRACPAVWESLGGPYQDLRLSLELADSSAVHPASFNRAGLILQRECGDSAAFYILPAATVAQYNTGYPRPQQDGLRWAGRGASSSFMAGVGFHWKLVSAQLAPIASFQQNTDFETLRTTNPQLSPFADYFHQAVLDEPQRFGDRSFWWLGFGQSFLRLDTHGVGIGFSTENVRWGPARRNPLLMSSAGPGIPHLFVSTSKPIDVRIGTVEADAMWGRLHESDYFDTRSDNNQSLFAGVVVSFAPYNSGLTLGVSRAYLDATIGSLSRQLLKPYTNVSANSRENQLLSGFVRWKFSASLAEVYGEFARDDHWENMNDLLLEPDHSRAYTIGVEKLFRKDSNRGLLRITAEMTNLNRSETWQSGRGRVSFYTHGGANHGYTQRGQQIGAPISTGSDAQYIAIDYVKPSTMFGAYAERIRYNNDTYYDLFAPAYTYAGHDAELTLGARGAGTFMNLQVVVDIARSSRRNRGFVEFVRGGGLSNDSNFSLTLGGAWVPVRKRP